MPLKYIDNVLHLQQREAQYSLLDMAREVGQPFYLYDLEGIGDRISFFKSSFHPKVKIHYALKANNNPDVLKIINKHELGVDVVSGGELTFATNHGFSGDRIIFSGVGKTTKEIRQAIELELFR
jgi:diaminopimelate decarboxylase